MKIILVLLVVLTLTGCMKSGSDIKHSAERNIFPNNKQPVEAEQNDSAVSHNSKSKLINVSGKTIYDRFNTLEGFERIAAEEGTFVQYLRYLPLKSDQAKVLLYNGMEKSGDIYEAVIDMDIGDRDLQQCADAVIRLRAEYLYKKGLYDKISFNFTNGFKADYIKWMQGYRMTVHGNKAGWVKRTGYANNYKVFREYLDIVFAYAGTISLSKELKKVSLEDMKIGDVFIQSQPGHCVIVVDMAENRITGEKLFMLAQSYMPAQDIHILKNPLNEKISPWYFLNSGETLITPEWRFNEDDLKRFDE